MVSAKIKNGITSTQTQDADFREEFLYSISNATIPPEADKTFTHDVFDDTFLNKDMVIARGAGKSENVQQHGKSNYVWLLREGPSEQEMITRCLTHWQCGIHGQSYGIIVC